MDILRDRVFLLRMKMLDTPMFRVLLFMARAWQEGDVGKLLQRRLSSGATEPVSILSQPGGQRVDSQEQTLAQKTPYMRRLEGWSRPGGDFPLLHSVASFPCSLCLELSDLGPFLQHG